MDKEIKLKTHILRIFIGYGSRTPAPYISCNSDNGLSHKARGFGSFPDYNDHRKAAERFARKHGYKLLKSSRDSDQNHNFNHILIKKES